MALVTERAEIEVRSGHEEAFAVMMAAEGKPLLQAVPGVLGVRFGRGVESPRKFLLLVEWADLSAHQAFAGTEQQATLRALFGLHSESGAMEHFRFD